MTSVRATSLLAIQRQFDRRAHAFSSHDFLFRESEARMFERLDLVRSAPQCVLDLGCGPGRSFAALTRRYPDAQLFGVDVSGAALALARAGWRRPGSSWWRALIGERVRAPRLVQASFTALPFAAASFDMLFSNLALHFAAEPSLAFAEWSRVVREHGLLMFSCFGPDTLKEVRAAWSDSGAPPAVIPFIDMHDLGDMMIEAGFTTPVVDMELVTLTYASVDTLFAELHAVTGNPLVARPRGLGGRRRLQRARDALEAGRDSDGRIRVSIELVNGHAWRGAERQRADVQSDGTRITRVPIERIARPKPPGA